MSTETETAIEVTEEERDLGLKSEGRRSEESGEREESEDSEVGTESVDEVAVVIESKSERREMVDVEETAVEVEDVDEVAA